MPEWVRSLISQGFKRLMDSAFPQFKAQAWWTGSSITLNVEMDELINIHNQFRQEARAKSIQFSEVHTGRALETAMTDKANGNGSSSSVVIPCMTDKVNGSGSSSSVVNKVLYTSDIDPAAKGKAKVVNDNELFWHPPASLHTVITPTLSEQSPVETLQVPDPQPMEIDDSAGNPKENVPSVLAQCQNKSKQNKQKITQVYVMKGKSTGLKCASRISKKAGVDAATLIAAINEYEEGNMDGLTSTKGLRRSPRLRALNNGHRQSSAQPSNSRSAVKKQTSTSSTDTQSSALACSSEEVRGSPGRCDAGEAFEGSAEEKKE